MKKRGKEETKKRKKKKRKNKRKKKKKKKEKTTAERVKAREKDAKLILQDTIHLQVEVLQARTRSLIADSSSACIARFIARPLFFTSGELRCNQLTNNWLKTRQPAILTTICTNPYCTLLKKDGSSRVH